MFSVLLQASGGPERDLLIAELWEAGAAGITEETDTIRAFFEDDVGLEAVLEQLSTFHPVASKEEPHDWVRFAQDQWQPFALGERFFLVPEWRDDPAPEGRLRLQMHPGMACGSGTHPATRLCLLAMEKHIRAGQTVLDVGTGAGILADAALLLGAGAVFGCDIEHDATLVALGNLPAAIGLFTGSVRSVRADAIDWAVCNLNLATLQTIAPDARRAARSLILSGFREEEASRTAALFPGPIREEFELEGYACLVL